MNDALDALGKGWVGSILGIIGIVLAFVFYAKSRVRPQLVWKHLGWDLIGGKHAALGSQVEIRFRGEVVPRVTLCEAVIWNAGTATVKGADVVESDRLRLSFPPGTRVLDARILSVTRAVNALAIRPEGSDAVLGFDYLDSGDGARVTVLHTADPKHPKFIGTVRGMPSVPNDWGQWELAPPRSRRIAAFSVMALGIPFLGFALARPAGRAAFFWIGVLSVLVGLGQLADLFRAYPNALSRRSDQPTAKPNSGVSGSK